MEAHGLSGAAPSINDSVRLSIFMGAAATG